METQPGHNGDERARSEQREVNSEVEDARREEEQALVEQQDDAENHAPDFVPQDHDSPERERVQQVIRSSREITANSKRLQEQAQVSVDRAKEVRSQGRLDV